MDKSATSSSEGTRPSSNVVPPAKFTTAILEAIGRLLEVYMLEGGLILDPFAGTGGVHQLASEKYRTLGVEIEAPWATVHTDTIQADALHLPFADGTFDCACTSRVYGNRFSDHHKARDGSLRRSYTHDLQRMTGDAERTLHPNNAGTLQWGDRYRDFHERAWGEVRRVLKPGAMFILNSSDHIRNGEVQRVTDWHLSTAISVGFNLIGQIEVPTARMRNGANSAARVDHEVLATLRK